MYIIKSSTPHNPSYGTIYNDTVTGNTYVYTDGWVEVDMNDSYTKYSQVVDAALMVQYVEQLGDI